MGQYITPGELRGIADLCDYFEGAPLQGDIYVGPIEVSDVNGETLGYVRISESGAWALCSTKEDSDVR